MRPERSALLVTVDTVEASSGYLIEREFAGRIEARRQSDVGFELGGSLKAVSVDEGDYVEAGQALAWLDTARLEARLAEASAAVGQARSASRFASRTLERSRVAASFEGISEQELDLALDNANGADAALAAATARVASVNVDLEKSVLRAPFDAVVIGRYVDEGRILSPGEPVLALQEARAPEARIGIAGDLSARLVAGDRQTLVVNGRAVDAVIDTILPVRDPKTRTVDVLLTLDNADVLPGDLARLVLEQSVDVDGFWLPVGALAEGNRGIWTAYVAVPVDGGGRLSDGATHYLEPRPVEVLHETSDRVYVRGALDVGERYVTGGLARVVPNLRVRIAGSERLASANQP